MKDQEWMNLGISNSTFNDHCGIVVRIPHLTDHKIRFKHISLSLSSQ